MTIEQVFDWSGKTSRDYDFVRYEYYCCIVIMMCHTYIIMVTKEPQVLEYRGSLDKKGL